MELQRYLERIKLRREQAWPPSQSALDAVVRAHLHSIAFENLDSRSGRPVLPSTRRAYDKIVTQRRGPLSAWPLLIAHGLMVLLPWHCRRLLL